MISVVCAYSSRSVLEKCLLLSLSTQEGEFETVLVDNREGKFKSAAAALNYGGELANGDLIVFAHQDIMLGSKETLVRFETVLRQMPGVGIAGVAGKRDSSGVLSNITHGTPPVKAGRLMVREPTEVQTLDECLVVIPARTFGTLHFDEVVCDGWHLYSVDYCLSVRRLGLSAIVIPCEMHHLSSGEMSITDDYYSTLTKVMDKHRGTSPSIYTTMGNWHVGWPIMPQRVYAGSLRWFSWKTGAIAAGARRIAEKIRN